MSPDEIRAEVERLASLECPPDGEARACVERLFAALESGEVRAASRVGGEWVAHAWVKRGILLAFRVGENRSFGSAGAFRFRDRDTLGTWDPDGAADRNVRIVPGGSTVRRGAFLADGVVVMPPAYVNVGAWIGPGAMIDSHALVGSCAQVGAEVHLSAAAQVGGVLEPVGAVPVVIEDGAFVGGGCGIYEGTRVGTRAVLASGVILTRSVPIWDLVHEREIRADRDAPLVVPGGAVVVPGSRPASGAFARKNGLQVSCPVIVKYRDESTNAVSALEQALR